MQLGEILDRLDAPTEPGEGNDLIEELGFDRWVDLSQHGFTHRAITAWNCTDTWVGRNAVYMDGELVAITNQEARKCDVIWEWASEDAYDRVRDRVHAAISEKEGRPSIRIIDRDKEMGMPRYQLCWANEVLWHSHHRTALWKDQEVTVLGAGDQEYLCNTVKVNLDGEEHILPLSELWFAVPLRKA